VVPARTEEAHRELRRGILYSLAAYGLWGVLPLYWPLLKPAAAIEILAHRILWSLAVVGLPLARMGGFGWLGRLGRRRLGLVSLAALLIACNWGTYIWGVNHAHVVETALGYFINPLVTVLLGVLVLGERLRPAQWIALGLSAVAVLILTLDYGHPPWVALTLASSFALYGLVKKRAGVGALQSLAVETGVLLLPALGYLAFLKGGSFLTDGPVHALLLMSTGLVTAVPLLFFGAAANRVPLSILGILQYLAPTLQFICGVALMHEPMAASRWVGFALVWVGLTVFALDAFQQRRRAGQAVLVAEAPAIELD
jgi:chloramphenicol-sensitive protein RarD